MNALMAIAMAVNFTPTDAIAKALASFKGIRRRFSPDKKTDKVYIDDYAIIQRKLMHIKRLELYPDKSSCLVSASFIQQNKRFC
jgi:UDP-N-acetylmuramate--alanine ligase